MFYKAVLILDHFQIRNYNRALLQNPKIAKNFKEMHHKQLCTFVNEFCKIITFQIYDSYSDFSKISMPYYIAHIDTEGASVVFHFPTALLIYVK